jgi:uncharacterized membrane protein YkvA (DUF1232 family)
MTTKLKPFNLLKILSKYRKIIKATLTDDRVPSLLKYGLIGTIIYIVSPVDILPDVLPIIGQIDDIGLIIAVLERIKSNLPPHVMDEIDGKIIKGL